MANIDVFENLRSWANKDLLALFDQIVFFFPHDMKVSLRRVVNSIPQDGDKLLSVFEIMKEQWQGVQPRESLNIAVAGPAQAGKKSLARMLNWRPSDPEKRIFTVVDTGDFEEYLGYGPRGTPAELSAADLIMLVLDASLALTDSTTRMYERLSELKKPVLVLLNKTDEVEHPAEMVRLANRQLKTTALPVSVKVPTHSDDLFRSIVAACPKALYPLAWNFPTYRAAVCRSIVMQSTFAGAASGALPIPVSPSFSVAAVQVPMILKIARAYGFPLDARRAVELLGVLALDLLIAQGTRSLQKKYPGKKLFIAAGIAGVSTLAIGHLAVLYFDALARALEDRREDFENPEGDDEAVWG